MKYKRSFIVVVLMAIALGILFYSLKDKPTLPEGVLIRVTTTAMGAKTTTTVSDTGAVIVASDFLNESTTYTLTPDQLQKVNEIVNAEDGSQYMFVPDPDIVYDGTYTLELRYKDSLVRHTSVEPQHEMLMEIIQSARPQ